MESTALCMLLPEGQAPEWVELLPGGREITGRDGRKWLNDQPWKVVEAFAANRAPLPIDWEHASELKAPNGDPAPAAAWIEEMEVRAGGAIWGRVNWTARGAEMVSSREYRFLSPVILYEKASSRIVAIHSAGLTNKPNLVLTALNREEENVDKDLLAALGLPETATVADALNAISKLRTDLATATNRAQVPDLDKFVPRGEYDSVLVRANNAERRLLEIEQSTKETQIVAAVDGALKAGKITPATREFYLATCRQEGGLKRFEAFLQSAPVLVPDSGLDTRAPDTASALNAETLAVAKMFGNNPDDIKKHGLAGA